ncbi:MAG TPA: AMP-binding protein [Jatrophihabitans sp.]|uniref:AMP-binding protein n=1 Tax=Jatrophihabitans sp. TaxID=1932789 RepID=UPI002E091942|nr:AMP-binding protein [Jatrophihabitans sp.]
MTGIHCGTVERTYDEVRGRAARIASGLAGFGVEAGDRVAIYLHNDIAFVEASLGAGILGGVPVPVNWHWKGAELAHLLDDSGSKAVFAHTDLVPVAEAVIGDRPLIEVEQDGVAPTGRHPLFEDWLAGHGPWAEPPTQAPQSMIYTSGTTGRPKGIIRNRTTPEQSQAIAQLVFSMFGLDPAMRTLVPAPIYHTAPNVHCLVSAAAGVDLTIMPTFEPEEMLRLIESQRIEHFQAVPTMFVRLLALPTEVRERYDLSSLKAIVHAAAPCPVEVKKRIIAWLGPIVLEYYGGSETGGVVTCTSEEWLAHPGTVGRAFGGSAIRIYDEFGDELPVGESGQVYVKPPASWPNFTYHNDAAKRAGIERDGFLHIGDVGYLDHDGFLYLNDRSIDMIISGGVNIYPAEIEACLLELDGVTDVAVFGIPDDDFGEAVAAHVEATGITEDDVREHVRANLAGYKVPKLVVFDDHLPREDTGKLFKRRIRARYWPA